MEERQESTGVDRRRFIKGAATVAWATPLILTLGARSASGQVDPPGPSPGECITDTGRPEGCPCTASSQCEDGCCCSVPVGNTGPGGCTSPGNCDDLQGACRP